MRIREPIQTMSYMSKCRAAPRAWTRLSPPRIAWNPQDVGDLALQPATLGAIIESRVTEKAVHTRTI